MFRVIRSLMNGNANAMYLSVRHHAIISCITLLTEPQVGVCDKYKNHLNWKVVTFHFNTQRKHLVLKSHLYLKWTNLTFVSSVGNQAVAYIYFLHKLCSFFPSWWQISREEFYFPSLITLIWIKGEVNDSKQKIEQISRWINAT